MLALLTALLSSERAYETIVDTVASPLNRLYDCTAAPRGDEPCGPAVANRTDWPLDYCALSRRSSRTLENQTLDVILMPDEDETLFLVDDDGNTYLGGIVGEVLNAIALEGGFTINAIVIKSCCGDGVYESWTDMAIDWTNRGDLIGAWFYDNQECVARRPPLLLRPSPRGPSPRSAG